MGVKNRKPVEGHSVRLEFAVIEGAVSLARLRRSSNRTSEELPHCTAPRLAAICGTSLSSIHLWKQIETFPRPNKKGEFCIRDCVQWYLVNRASKEIREEVCRRSAESLKLKFVGDDAEKTDGVTVKSETDIDYKEHVNLLDLRTKEAAFQMKYGDAVRIRHIVPILVALARKIREFGESIERSTGYPVSSGIEQAVDQAISEMQDKTQGGGDASAIE